MPNNTETYWSVGGESLHTYARSIETLGPALRVPKFRGTNLVVLNRPGDIHVPKVMDSNTITLQMWVRGIAEGSTLGGSPNRVDFDSNWNNLVRLLWNSGRRFNLTKRFYDKASNTLITATAVAEFVGGFEPTMVGANAGKFQVDLKISDALFFADTVQTVTLVNGDNIVAVAGNADTLNFDVEILGIRNNTTLWNKTNGTRFTYPDSVPTSGKATISPLKFEAEYQLGVGAPVDTTYKVEHSGATQWMILRPGNNTINLASTSGSGTVRMLIRGAWT